MAHAPQFAVPSFQDCQNEINQRLIESAAHDLTLSGREAAARSAFNAGVSAARKIMPEPAAARVPLTTRAIEDLGPWLFVLVYLPLMVVFSPLLLLAAAVNRLWTARRAAAGGEA